jgi:hypothetical protein
MMIHPLSVTAILCVLPTYRIDLPRLNKIAAERFVDRSGAAAAELESARFEARRRKSTTEIYKRVGVLLGSRRDATPNIGNLLRRAWHAPIKPKPTAVTALLARLHRYNAAERAVGRTGVAGREDILGHWRKLSGLATDLHWLDGSVELRTATPAARSSLREEISSLLTEAVQPTDVFGAVRDERTQRACDQRLQTLLSIAIDARQTLDLKITNVLGVPVLLAGS